MRTNEQAKTCMKKLRDRRKELGLCECGNKIYDNRKKCNKCYERITKINRTKNLNAKKYVRINRNPVNFFMYLRMEEIKMSTALLSAITGISQRQIERMITEGAVPRNANAKKVNKALGMTIFKIDETH